MRILQNLNNSGLTDVQPSSLTKFGPLGDVLVYKLVDLLLCEFLSRSLSLIILKRGYMVDTDFVWVSLQCKGLSPV